MFLRIMGRLGKVWPGGVHQAKGQILTQKDDQQSEKVHEDYRQAGTDGGGIAGIRRDDGVDPVQAPRRAGTNGHADQDGKILLRQM